jgi:hypothetical protein
MQVLRNPATKVLVFQCRAGWQPAAARPWGPATGARHVGAGPGFIDKHQVVWVEVELPLEPLQTAPQDVGAILFGRVAVFLRVIWVF